MKGKKKMQGKKKQKEKITSKETQWNEQQPKFKRKWGNVQNWLDCGFVVAPALAGKVHH